MVYYLKVDWIFAHPKKIGSQIKKVFLILLKNYKITGVIVCEKMIIQGVINENEISVDTIQRYI